MDKILEFLCTKVVDPHYTCEIRDNFPDLLLLIVSKAFPLNSNGNHLMKCIALGKLLQSSQDIIKQVLITLAICI